jgi:hypothetical protein
LDITSLSKGKNGSGSVRLLEVMGLSNTLFLELLTSGYGKLGKL